MSTAAQLPPPSAPVAIVPAAAAAKPVKTGANEKRVTLSEKLGLALSVARVEKHLRDKLPGTRISKGFAIVMTVYAQMLIEEVLEMSAEVTVEKKKKQITTHHVNLGLEKDAQIKALLKTNSLIPEGGVVPFYVPTKKELIEAKKKQRALRLGSALIKHNKVAAAQKTLKPKKSVAKKSASASKQKTKKSGNKKSASAKKSGSKNK